LTDSLLDLACALVDNGYSPVFLRETGKPLTAWKELRQTPMTKDQIQHVAEKGGLNLGLGVVGGFNGLVPIDIDTDDPDIMKAIGKAIHSPNVAKRGTKGRTAFYRSVDDVQSHRFTPPLRNASPLVEILTRSVTTIPPSLHRVTKKPYRWLNGRSLFSTPIEELCEITANQVERLYGVMEGWCPRKDEEPPRPILRRRVAEEEFRRYQGYARAAIDRECGDLQRLMSGRNTALNMAAYSLGRFVHNGIVSDDEVRSALMDAMQHNGYLRHRGRHTAKATINSGFNASRNHQLPDLDS
jgi:hypothetical protein